MIGFPLSNGGYPTRATTSSSTVPVSDEKPANLWRVVTENGCSTDPITVLVEASDVECDDEDGLIFTDSDGEVLAVFNWQKLVYAAKASVIK
jgi:hypothetical protein